MLKTLAAAAVLLCATLVPILAEPTGQEVANNEQITEEIVKPSVDQALDIKDDTEEVPEVEVELRIPDGDKSGVTDASKDAEEKTRSLKEKAEPTAREKAQAARRSRLAREALSYRGTPYVWGGEGRTGFDCSGFTQYLYAQRGVRLPHSARKQYDMGKPVARDDLQVGDLVFFNTRGPISHVGMFIGEGKFIHAANPRRGVTVNSLSDEYYSKRYAGARRLISQG